MPLDTAPITFMHIGELAEKSKMSLRTIRHYDDVGLLKPSARSDGGFRLYTVGDLERLLMIRQVKALGFSLDEMAHILDVIASLRRRAPSADTAELQRVLDTFIEQALTRRAKLADYLARGDDIIGTMKGLRES